MRFWLHLAAVMEQAGRRIVSESMSEVIDASLVWTALKSTSGSASRPRGLRVPIDGGVQYASGRYRTMAADLGITTPMSLRSVNGFLAPVTWVNSRSAA